MIKPKKIREGKRKRGVLLKKVCGFCGKRFRAQSQRNDHTNICEK
jgi:hypothetical protein